MGSKEIWITVRPFLFGFICVLILITLAGVITADTVLAEVAYVQGGHMVISNGTDGISELTITDIVPYFNIADGDLNRLMPVKTLSNMSTPVYAALVLSGTGNEMVALVSISNLTLSDDTNTMVLQVKPLEYYDGEILKSFNQARTDLTSFGNQTGTGTGFYLELHQVPTNNPYGNFGTHGPITW